MVGDGAKRSGRPGQPEWLNTYLNLGEQMLIDQAFLALHDCITT